MIKRLFSILLLSFLLIFSSCAFFRNKHTMILGKIQDAADIATVEFTLKKYVIAKQNRKIMYFISLDDAVFVAETKAVIKAGIDINEIEHDDIKIIDNTIEVTLPQVKIINFSYSSDDFIVDDKLTKNEYLIKNISYRDIDDFYRQAEIDIRNQINYLGIEEECQIKTRLFLTAFLKKAGYEAVIIKFKDNENKLLNVDEDIIKEIEAEYKKGRSKK